MKKYQEEGESGLEQKRKPGNPLSRYERRKELTYEEQLQYQIELFKRELLKKETEVARLKKQNEREGDGFLLVSKSGAWHNLFVAENIKNFI